jgi:hypothetical protein
MRVVTTIVIVSHCGHTNCTLASIDRYHLRGMGDIHASRSQDLAGLLGI